MCSDDHSAFCTSVIYLEVLQKGSGWVLKESLHADKFRTWLSSLDLYIHLENAFTFCILSKYGKV